MKNLGGITIDFTEDNGKYNAAIGLDVSGAPKKIMAMALVSVVARLARDNKQFMNTFIDELGKLVGLEDEPEDESGIAEQ